MHEWGLACQLVDRIAEEGRTRGADRITRVRVRVGSLSGVVPEALTFGFEAAAKGTIIATDALLCEEIPAEAVCNACKTRYPDPDGLDLCPSCHSADKKIVAGTEMETVSFAMERDDV